MSQCGDQKDIVVYVFNVLISIAISVYFLPCKKITLYIKCPPPVNKTPTKKVSRKIQDPFDPAPSSEQDPGSQDPTTFETRSKIQRPSESFVDKILDP